MARVLLFDKIAVQAEKLRCAIQEQRNIVTVKSVNSIPDNLQQLVNEADVVVVALLLDRWIDWEVLRRVCALRLTLRRPLGVLALCSRAQGRAARRRARDLGAHSVYAD